ncbi:hypothetical protein SEVIR_3G340400v4 [Setaria viridis]|uniref:Rapid alkalinization factor 1 n=1 Tax=Setaria viridis TaxID=4556 RepID=A0A4U6VGA8_SETVI|nr:uncharacterized protein LOC117850722 [Setaria viridis]TKW28611.1 hypothetical protein SEVIR_3G340400v2 [Setaria viridis]
MAATSLPLAAVLFLLLAASAGPATASGQHSGARMVIIRRGAGLRAGGGSVAAGARANDKRRYDQLLEDEVAPEPELRGLMRLGAGDGGGSIGYGALEKDRPGCQSGNQCAAQGGGSYTRGCTYKDHCPH